MRVEYTNFKLKIFFVIFSFISSDMMGMYVERRYDWEIPTFVSSPTLFFFSLSGPVLMYNFDLLCSNQLVRFNLNALHSDSVCHAGTKMGPGNHSSMVSAASVTRC